MPVRPHGFRGYPVSDARALIGEADVDAEAPLRRVAARRVHVDIQTQHAALEQALARKGGVTTAELLRRAREAAGES